MKPLFKNIRIFETKKSPPVLEQESQRIWERRELLGLFSRSRSSGFSGFNHYDIDSMETFIPFFEIIGNSLSGLEGLEAFHADAGKMSENILAAFIGGNKTIPFGVVKPFNCTLCHKKPR